MSYQITRRQGNLNGTLINASFVTAQQTSADQANTNGSGVIVVLDVTALKVGGMANTALTLLIQGKDSASGKYYTLLTSDPVSTLSTVVYMLSPDIPHVPARTVRSLLPATWRVLVKASNANPVSYTVGCSVIQ